MDVRRRSHIEEARGQKNAGRKNRPDLEADRGRDAAKSLQSRLITRDAGGGRLGFRIHREIRDSKAVPKPTALPVAPKVMAMTRQGCRTGSDVVARFTDLQVRPRERASTDIVIGKRSHCRTAIPL
jgi:hypothetical protein